MHRRLVSMLGGLCSSLLALGGVATVLPFHDAASQPSAQLYFTSGHGITAFDANNGAETFTTEGGVASGDWRRLVTATPAGNGTTTLRAIDAFDGELTNDTSLTGTLDVRAVSYYGDLVALSPDARAVNGRQPGRSRTRLVVASTTGTQSTRSYDIAANIEPEAFSTDGRALFVVQYLPPMEPNRYQVRRLDLETGALTLVQSVDGANQGQMPGIARTSVLAPDGKRLYTLYTSEEGGQRYSFVHVLDLDQQWAHCVDLAPAFGSDPEAMAIAINSIGTRVYVADVAAGKLAAINTSVVRVDSVTRLPIRGVHARPALAASAARVYVAAQRNLVALEAFSGITSFHSTLASPVRGLHSVPAGGMDLLYVAERHAIARLDGKTGHREVSIPADNPRLTGLGFQYPPPSGDTYQCAC